MSNSALASLTEQYTDSENEDDLKVSPDSENSQASQASLKHLEYLMVILKFCLRSLYLHLDTHPNSHQINGKKMMIVKMARRGKSPEKRLNV